MDIATQGKKVHSNVSGKSTAGHQRNSPGATVSVSDRV
jgi:hypothetical protein